MSNITQEVNPATSHLSEPESLVHRIFPSAIVVIGLGLSGAWIILLGYGFVRLVELLIVD